MKKILALDPGDQHIGTAISDELQMLAEPYKTIKPTDLHDFLTKLISTEDVGTIVIGYPKTMRGTISTQTQKSIDLKSELTVLFPNIEFVLWDERLTSQSASLVRRAKNKNDRLQQHSIAAAIILQTYLDRTLYYVDKGS